MSRIDFVDALRFYARPGAFRDEEMEQDLGMRARKALEGTRPGVRLFLDAARLVLRERERQERIGDDKKAKGYFWSSCADPESAPPVNIVALGEEYGEACKAYLDYGAGSSEYLQELTHAAAVAVAMVEGELARVENGGREER